MLQISFRSYSVHLLSGLWSGCKRSNVDDRIGFYPGGDVALQTGRRPDGGRDSIRQVIYRCHVVTSVHMPVEIERRENSAIGNYSIRVNPMADLIFPPFPPAVRWLAKHPWSLSLVTLKPDGFFPAGHRHPANA